MTDDFSARMNEAAGTLGLDFGTTNSVAALLAPDGSIETARFTHGGETETVCRSAISFFNTGGTTMAEVGPWAVDRYLADPMDCRFLQSFKTFAASPSFKSTAIHGRAWRYEDLMAAFVQKMLAQSEPPLAATRRLVVGRPVAYAGHAPDAALAQTRYLAALAKCGIEDVHFVYEPVAAAFYFAQRLERDASGMASLLGPYPAVPFQTQCAGARPAPRPRAWPRSRRLPRTRASDRPPARHSRAPQR